MISMKIFKRKDAFNTKISDFKDDFRTIEKNKINIKISNSLYRDIQYSLLLANEIHRKNYLIDENIFHYIYGNKFKAEQLNEWFCHILRKIDFDMPDDKDSYSVEVISKTSIYNMIHDLVNPELISQLCGLKVSTLEEEFYGGKIEVEYIDEKINQEISVFVK